MRGPLVPPQVPFARTRAERFDDFVLDAVEELEGRWSKELASVEFAVEEVPPVDARAAQETGDDADAVPVPLSRCVPATGGSPPRIVIYRRPLEIRAEAGAHLGSLVYAVVVEELANVLGLEPELIDPALEDPDDGDEQ